MSTVLANLPADIFEIGQQDEPLTAVEQEALSLFDGLKKIPSFTKFPGSTVLRKCVAGQVMCRQGEAGASAFYILSNHDVIALRLRQLSFIETALNIDPSITDAPYVPTRFRRLARPALVALQRQFQEEIGALTDRQIQIETTEDEAARDNLLTMAKVKLLVALNPERPRRGLLHRLKSWFRGPARGEESPSFIPVDGLMSLDTRTLEAPLRQNEVFGEMSCLNRAPRAATVIVEQDCYMLEFLRNVLDMLYKDPVYKQRMDTIYRQRVLDKQVRQMTVFKTLSDEEFQQLQPRLELVEFEAGRVIFDEHEESDCMYLIRSGLVKVVKHATSLISKDQTGRISWSRMAQELTAGQSQPQSIAGRVWSKLGPDIQSALIRLAGGTAADPETQQRIVDEFNRFIRSGELLAAFGDKRSGVMATLDEVVIDELTASFPEKMKDWSEQRSRLFHRGLLEAACPHGLPHRERRESRTLRYLTKGDILGEIGLLTGHPRSASCLAYDQRDRGQELSQQDLEANPSRVELVRLNRADLADISPAFRRRLEEAKDQLVERLVENRPVRAAEVRSLQSQSPEFEELGLIQGQRLMLIDLEKCTRCGACVEACVDAHDDGRTRLYLDGPRFDKYLIPITCRSCLDPVCMIGCPVGAIYRGDNGEIRIRNHCIGCQLCADQCPYGSIHMSERELSANEPAVLFQLEAGVELKEFTQQAVVCDLCSSLNSQVPSCVYACPHDAAMRVDSREFFGVGE